MANAVYCGHCGKLFPQNKTHKITTEFSEYTDAFEDDYCEKCADAIEEAVCNLK